MAIQYSIQKMVSDGTLSTIALGIQYLQRNDIYIRIAGEDTPQSGAPSGYTWSFLDNTTLKILPVVPNGVEVVVYRRTDVDAMYNIYSQNAQFDEATIDENNQQLLYIAQEYLEQGLPGTGVDTIEYVRDDGSFTYYRMRRTDGSYSEEFTVPSASSSTKVLTRESLRRSYAEVGYNLVTGSFETGGTLVNANDALLHEASGKAFSGPAGTVAAGTDPTSGGFVDRSGYLTTFVAEMVGISTTNTPQQNTAAMDAFRAANPDASLSFFAGVYPFDVYRDSGLKKVRGRGKALTKITLLGAATPVSGQFGGAEVSDIHFESVAGSLENQRCQFTNGARLIDGKISGFIHSVPAPNAWGAYFKNSKGCKLIRVEFDNNSQSDIAVLEGTDDLEIDGCYSTTGNLVINYEPNVNTPSISKTTLRNMSIAELYLQSNDLLAESDYAAVVENCKVQKLVYDGLGVDFINTEIVSYEQPSGNRVYAGRIAGVSVYQEFILDPTLTVVCNSSNSASFWQSDFSTALPVDRYGRAPDYALRIGVNSVAASTRVVSKKFSIPATALLVSFIRSVTVSGGRPDVTQIEFFDASNASISVKNMVRGFNSNYELVSAIVVPPTGAVSARIVLYGSDTASAYQQVNYKYLSVRPISIVGTPGSKFNADFIGVERRAKVGITKAAFDASQHYWAPLPVGTEIEFEYAAAGARLAKITAAATDVTGKLGTLQIIANFP